MLTRYEKLEFFEDGFVTEDWAKLASKKFLQDFPEDIWEHDWWTSYNKENCTWIAGATVERIVPDAQDME